MSPTKSISYAYNLVVESKQILTFIPVYDCCCLKRTIVIPGFSVKFVMFLFLTTSHNWKNTTCQNEIEKQCAWEDFKHSLAGKLRCGGVSCMCVHVYLLMYVCNSYHSENAQREQCYTAKPFLLFSIQVLFQKYPGSLWWGGGKWQ